MYKIFSVGALPLLLNACATAPTPLPVVSAQLSATNAAVASPLSYRDPLAGYTYRGPTGPRDWRDVNREQTEAN